MEGDYEQRLKEFQERKAQEMQLEAILQKLLEPAVLERLSNIRASNPALYEKLVKTILMLYQSGRIQEKLGEEQFKQLAGRMTEQKDTKITFVRK